MTVHRIVGIVAGVLGGLLALIGFLSGWYIVSPGERAVLVILGRAAETPSGEGLHLKPPFISSVRFVSVRQETKTFNADAFSSDLQHLDITVTVLYRVPDASVVPIVKQYAGDPFESLVVPRVQEALKEVTAKESAEHIAREREMVKQRALVLAREKIGTFLHVEDLVLHNIKLSQELEKAIEAKMVQEQDAAKAKFSQLQATIEAKTAAIRAEGEANAIKIRGEAIKQNPKVIELQIVEKWNGVTPLVVGGTDTANVLLPVTGNK